MDRYYRFDNVGANVSRQSALLFQLTYPQHRFLIASPTDKREDGDLR